MVIKIGSSDIAAISVGSSPVVAVHVGTTKVWPPPSTITVLDTATATSLGSRSPTGTFSGSYTDPQENDLILCGIRIAAVGSMAGVTGWDNVLGGTTVIQSSAHTCLMLGHLVDSAEAAANEKTYTLTNLFGVDRAWRSNMLAIRGIDPADWIDAADSFVNTSASSTHQLAALSSGDITYASKVFRFTTGAASSGSYTTPGSHTAEQTGTAQGMYSLDGLTTPGVAVAQEAISLSVSTQCASISIALKPNNA